MNKILRLTPLSLLLTLALSGCDQQAKLTPEQQSGADPHLPAAQHFLLPPMQVPQATGWREGATPRVADGLKIEKIADGLQHPRQIYVLPDNDILVVESNSPGKGRRAVTGSRCYGRLRMAGKSTCSCSISTPRSGYS